MSQAAFKFGGDPYPRDFGHWLSANRRLFKRFEAMALEMAMSGRKSYSARTIVEVIRWNSDLSDSDKTFKINNNYTPGMARLWMAKHGHRFPKFFKCRDIHGNDK